MNEINSFIVLDSCFKVAFFGEPLVLTCSDLAQGLLSGEKEE